MAELIDYTTEALERRLLDHLNRGDNDLAEVLSSLLEGYLDGIFEVKWVDGDPRFKIREGLDQADLDAYHGSIARADDEDEDE